MLNYQKRPLRQCNFVKISKLKCHVQPAYILPDLISESLIEKISVTMKIPPMQSLIW